MRLGERTRPYWHILLLFLFLYAALWGWMRGVRNIFPNNPPNVVPEMYMGIPRETNPWLEVWQRWDALHYQAIAERGYRAFSTALFTPPLFPLLMRLTALLFNMNTLAAGLFISALASLGCLIALYRIALFEFGEEKIAFQAVLFLASFPTAFFLFAPYSESLFLLGALLAIYYARKERWWSAGLWGALAALTRIPGTLLLVPLLYAAWQAQRSGQKNGWFAPALTAAGSILYPLYVWLILGESPLAILQANYARGGYLTLPGLNLLHAALRAWQGVLVEENLIELFFALLFLVLTVQVWRHLPPLYGLYSATLLLFFLARFGSPQPLVGMARYGLEIFPIFLYLATQARTPRIRRLILYLSWPGLLFFSAQFAIWGWVG